MAIASGTSGTCSWTISDNGTLTVRPTNGSSGYILNSPMNGVAWRNYNDKIIYASFSGSIKIYVKPFTGDAIETGDASYLFSGFEQEECKKLKQVSGLSSLKNVRNTGHMFLGCDSLTSLDLSSFDTSKVTNMEGMFSYCDSLTSLNLSSFDTSNVTNMKHLFSDCGSLTSLNLSSFNTSNVTDMAYMFSGCGSLTSLNLSSFDTSNATNMNFMFLDCDILSTITFGDHFEVPDSEYNIGFREGVNQTNNIIVKTDESFRALTASQRKGTWLRTVSSTYEVTTYRTENNVKDEGGKDVQINVIWSTNATTTERTLSIFKKLNTDSAYPSTPIISRTLYGNSGSEEIVLSDVGSEAYDFKVQFYDGTNTFIAFPSVPATIELIVVSKTGDVKIAGDLFMRGKIQTDDQILVKTNIDSTTHPSSALYPKLIELQDTNGLPIGYVEGTLSTNGKNGISLTAKKMVSDTAKYNYLRLLVDDSGNPVVQVGNDAAWRTGLGLGSLATKSTVALVTLSKTSSAKYKNSLSGAHTFSVTVSCAADSGYKPIAVTGVYPGSTTGAGEVYLRGFNMNGYNAGPTPFDVVTYWRTTSAANIAANTFTAYVEFMTIKTSLS